MPRGGSSKDHVYLIKDNDEMFYPSMSGMCVQFTAREYFLGENKKEGKRKKMKKKRKITRPMFSDQFRSESKPNSKSTD